MTPMVEHFAYRQGDLLPFVPIEISRAGLSSMVDALVDSGASVNVLPYRVGLQLGAAWDELSVSVTLSGNLRNEAAKGLIVTSRIGQLPPVRLAFAWCRSDSVPVILGQTNFFQEFDVFISGSRRFVEIAQKNQSAR